MYGFTFDRHIGIDLVWGILGYVREFCVSLQFDKSDSLTNHDSEQKLSKIRPTKLKSWNKIGEIEGFKFFE